MVLYSVESIEAMMLKLLLLLRYHKRLRIISEAIEARVEGGRVRHI